MKHFFTLLLLSVVAAGLRAETSLTVKVTAPGELAAALGEDAKSIESLTVEGPVNAADFETMWRCSFEGKLTSLDLSKAEPVDNEIPDSAFCQFEAQGLKNHFGHGPSIQTRLKLSSISLPEGLERIGSYAFMFTDIESIKLPATLKELGNNCFYSCRELTGRIDLPVSVEAVPDSCFCLSSVTDVPLHSGIKKLGKAAFQLTDITGDPYIIPEGIVEIPDDCFRYTSYVKYFQLPSSLRTIAYRAFDSMITGPYKFDIPEGVEYIGECAFGGNVLNSFKLL